MGIPFLVKLLGPYRVPVEFKAEAKAGDRRRAVIDGPGLAHHAYHIALSRGSRSRHALEAVPAYRKVSAVVLSWLKVLEDHGIDVAAIYFDGKLPDAKRATRWARLQQYLRQLYSFRASYPNSLPQTTNSPHDTGDPDTDLFSERPVPAHLKLLPPAPFVVPAVIEALLGSRYSNTVHMVPGEADVYCAKDVRINGGFVVTGDSDLLVYHTGRQGSVVLLKDFSLSIPSPLLASDSYSNLYIQLSSLAKLAFVVSRNRGKRLSEVLKMARSVQNANKAYIAFRAEYELDHVLLDSFHSLTLADGTSPLNPSERHLDPRVSEFVLQDPNTTPTMYLPFLLDDPTRSSAWVCGTDLRLLGYATFISARASMTKTISEVQRKGNGLIVDVPLNLPATLEFQQQATTVSSSIQQWKKRLNARDDTIFWRCFITKSLLDDLNAQGKTLPTTRYIRKLLAASPVDNSWTYIHLWACFQAQMYSFRMLKQLLGTWNCFQHNRDTPDIVGDTLHGLAVLLDSMPDVSLLLDSNTSILSDDIDCLTKHICAYYSVISESVGPEGTQPKSKRTQNNTNQAAAASKASLGSNPFAALLETG